MEKFIFEKREATAIEKATHAIFDMQRKRILEPLFRGKEEAAWRLRSVADEIRYCPRVFVTKKSGYIPVRFRDGEKYFIVSKDADLSATGRKR